MPKENKGATPKVSPGMYEVELVTRENTWKSLRSMLILQVLTDGEKTTAQIGKEIFERSKESLRFEHNSQALAYLEKLELIQKSEARKTLDGLGAAYYYSITEKGKMELASIVRMYSRMTRGVRRILKWEEGTR